MIEFYNDYLKQIKLPYSNLLEKYNCVNYQEQIYTLLITYPEPRVYRGITKIIIILAIYFSDPSTHAIHITDYVHEKRYRVLFVIERLYKNLNIHSGRYTKKAISVVG